MKIEQNIKKRQEIFDDYKHIIKKGLRNRKIGVQCSVSIYKDDISVHYAYYFIEG